MHSSSVLLSRPFLSLGRDGRQWWERKTAHSALSSFPPTISYEENCQNLGAHSLGVWFLLVNSGFLETGLINGLL